MSEHEQELAAAPTPEQLAERAARADKATRGGAAGILAIESIVILLVPRAIAFTTGLGTVRTSILVALAVVLLAVACVQRRPWGIKAGTAMQVPFVLTGFFIVTMFFVGAVFVAIWARLLTLRHDLVGSRF